MCPNKDDTNPDIDLDKNLSFEIGPVEDEQEHEEDPWLDIGGEG